MVVDCIIIQKELFLELCCLWGILSLGYLYKIHMKSDKELTNFEAVIVYICIMGIMLLVSIICFYIFKGVVELLKLLPCIRVV